MRNRQPDVVDTILIQIRISADNVLDVDRDGLTQQATKTSTGVGHDHRTSDPAIKLLKYGRGQTNFAAIGNAEPISVRNRRTPGAQKRLQLTGGTKHHKLNIQQSGTAQAEAGVLLVGELSGDTGVGADDRSQGTELKACIVRCILNERRDVVRGVTQDQPQIVRALQGSQLTVLAGADIKCRDGGSNGRCIGASQQADRSKTERRTIGCIANQSL